jgi:O-antigen/teichoic acid export membrane protein
MIEPGSPFRNALSAVSFLWLGSLVGAVLAFLTQIVLARKFIPSEYGAFAAALTTVTLLVPLLGFGVQGFWLKSFGAEGWNALRWLPASFRYIALSTVGTLTTLAAWAIWGPHDAATRKLLLLLFPVTIGYLFVGLVTVKLQLEERYKALAVWQLLPNLFRFLLVLLVFAVTAKPIIDVIAAAYTMIAFVFMAAGFVQLRNMSEGRFILKGHYDPTVSKTKHREVASHEVVAVYKRVWEVARESWPFGLGGVFHLIYFQSNIILLKYIEGNEAAGIYNVAFTVMMGVYLLPSTIYQKLLLPKIHRWANHDRLRFLHVYRFGNGLMMLLGVGTTVAILLLVPWVIPLLFGVAYQKAVGLLQVLAFCVPLRFLASSVGATLVTQHHMHRKAVYMGITAVVNVLLNLVLIPIYGAMGAAAATVLSECTLLALYLFAVRRYVFGRDAWRGWTLRYKERNNSS